MTTKSVHHAALKGAFPGKPLHRGPDCAYCRNSAVDPVTKLFGCKLNLPGPAARCIEWSDSRISGSFIPPMVTT